MWDLKSVPPDLSIWRGWRPSDEESTKVTECRFADDYTVFTTTTVLCLQKQRVSMRGASTRIINCLLGEEGWERTFTKRTLVRTHPRTPVISLVKEILGEMTAPVFGFMGTGKKKKTHKVHSGARRWQNSPTVLYQCATWLGWLWWIYMQVKHALQAIYLSRSI